MKGVENRNPGRSRWALCNSKRPYKRDTRRSKARERGGITEAEVGVICFEVGRRDREQRNAGSL